MKKTVFHELYHSMRKDWDAWIIGLSALSLIGYGLYWLSKSFDLNPLHWLAALGEYGYQHGGTAGFIVVALCVAAVILVPSTVYAWKETKIIKTGPAPWDKKPVTAYESKDTKEALKEAQSLCMEIKNLKHKLDLIERNVTEIREILKTTE